MQQLTEQQKKAIEMTLDLNFYIIKDFGYRMFFVVKNTMLLFTKSLTDLTMLLGL